MSEYLTSKEAFFLLQEAGICKNINFLYNHTKNGNIKGVCQIRSQGYFYKEEDIASFIDQRKPPTKENPLTRLKQLEEENYRLKHVSKDIVEEGYKKRILQLENENERLKNAFVCLEGEGYTLSMSKYYKNHQAQYMIAIPEYSICFKLTFWSKDPNFFILFLDKLPANIRSTVAEQLTTFT